MKRLKYLATIIAGQSPESADVHDFTSGMPFLQGNAEFGSRYPSPKLQCASSMKVAMPGDILVSVRAPVGALNMVDQKYGIGRGLAAVRPRSIDSRYLWWWMHTQIEELQSESTGSTFAAVSAADIANLQIPVEDSNLQEAIAVFLDRETVQIDDLIGKQESLIALLAEKRRAVISHAVTKGLDPTVPTKPSGLPWLGEIPASWTISAIKREWTVIDCKHVTAEFVGDGIPLASIREVQGKFVNLATAKCTTVDFYRSMIEGNREPRAGDLIFSRNATVGEVAIVPRAHEPFAMGQDVCMLKRQSRETSPEFGWYALRSHHLQQQISLAMIGSTFKRINVEEIRSLSYCVPPPKEQRTIAKYLDEKVSVIDEAVVAADKTVALLRERRSAIISAAVTGKIDVREKVS